MTLMTMRSQQESVMKTDENLAIEVEKNQRQVYLEENSRLIGVLRELTAETFQSCQDPKL